MDTVDHKYASDAAVDAESCDRRRAVSGKRMFLQFCRSAVLCLLAFHFVFRGLVCLTDDYPTALFRSTSHHHIHGHHHCHHGDHHSSVSYPGEHIKWKPCGGGELAGRPLECSAIDVPMDQFNASNSGSKTFTIPLIRLRGSNATQSILLNPGGPGGSGLNFMYRRGKLLSDILGEGLHLLSFDPRGVNMSRPAASCFPDDETRLRNPELENARVPEDAADLFSHAKNLVQACADTMGEHGKYIDTPQTAADMNSILDAIGQQDMVYWGFSYGTLLGQTYATLFPERSKRVIIDGVANQFDWYQSRFDRETFESTEDVFDGFLDECTKAGPKNCSLAALTPKKEYLYGGIMSLADNLAKEPLAVYHNASTYGLIHRSTVFYQAIFPTLYKPANWPGLADKLTGLLEGNATAFFLDYAFNTTFPQQGSDAFRFVSWNDGLSGPAHWSQDLASVLHDMAPYLNQSLFAPAELGGIFEKQQWRVEQTHRYVPQRGVHTAHPLLILSTTYDPVCPLVSARSANAAFVDSRLVEVKGYGHCSVSVPSMCLAKRVREFLYEGKLPDENVQCEVDGNPYFPGPEEGKNAVGDGDGVRPLVHFETEEERRIHLAQVELARDLWF